MTDHNQELVERARVVSKRCADLAAKTPVIGKPDPLWWERQSALGDAADKINELLAGAAIAAAQPDGVVAETWQTISDWCDETFGPATPLRMAARANEEMAELIDKATQTQSYDESVLIEAADVVICLARFPGLWAAVERKMAINRARKWRLTGEGTGYHIPAALSAPEPVEEQKQ